MGGRKSRDKGNRTERAAVLLLKERGFAAERIPLSGSAGGKFCGDISWPILGREWCVEVKCEADGFKRDYDWLEGRDLLIKKADNRAFLVTLTLDKFLEIAWAAEKAKPGLVDRGALALA